MTVCVIGSAGNMGRRYCAILDHLGVEYEGFDLVTSPSEGRRPGHFLWRLRLTSTGFTHYIIATPTDTHAELLRFLMDRFEAVNVLVEKPVTRDPAELRALVKAAEKGGHDVYMVNQYAYGNRGAPPGVPRGKGYPGKRTEYNYFNSGKDGLIWDCIQLLHLAKADIYLANISPERICIINGRVYRSDATDWLYIKMIRDFLGRRKWLWPIAEVIETHERANEYEKNIDRSAGPIHLHTPAE